MRCKVSAKNNLRTGNYTTTRRSDILQKARNGHMEILAWKDEETCENQELQHERKTTQKNE